jgi:hypothetical protein
MVRHGGVFNNRTMLLVTGTLASQTTQIKSAVLHCITMYDLVEATIENRSWLRWLELVI